MELNLSEKTRLSAQLVMTGRGCVIGQSGSGKSFLMGIIAEELGKLNLPFCIIDTEGEYSSLKETLPNILIVGGDNADVPIDVDKDKLFISSINNSIPIILDVSDTVQKAEYVYNALSSLYNIEESLRKPFLVMIEEADKFAPQIVHQKINIIEELSVRGRKRGIGLLIATQRPSNISKNVLSQCSYGFIGKLTIENDLNAISQLFSSRTTLDEIVNLGIGEFMPFGISDKEKIKVKSRLAFHMGSTPQVGEFPANNKFMAESLIKELNSEKKNNTMIQKEGKKSIKKLEEQVKVDIITPNISEEYAKDYAKKVSKKALGIFGRNIENIDKIEKKYLPSTFYTIRIPTNKKREFDEYSILLTKEGFPIKLKNKIIIKVPQFKYQKLSPLEEEILAEVRLKKTIKKIDILKNYTSKNKGASLVLQRLASRKLIDIKNDKIYSNVYKDYDINYNMPKTEETIPLEEIDGEAITTKQAIIALKSLFPTCYILNTELLYIPIYEITLRNKSKVRIFKIDAVFGKELSYI